MTPTLPNMLKRAVAEYVDELHVACPGRIEKYDPAKQRAEVLPLVVKNGKAYPPIPNVPVCTFGGGGFRITFPIKVGDTVLLVFSERSLDKWLTDGTVADPYDPRHHDLTDAIAIPGLRDFGHPVSDAHADHATIGKEGGPQIFFKEGEIALGEENPSDAVAMASKVKEEIKALRDLYAEHGHPVSTSGTAAAQAGLTGRPMGTLSPTPAPGPPTGTPQVVMPVGDVGSTTIKVKS